MAKPLDFVQQPNHDWAQRYIANKMGIRGQDSQWVLSPDNPEGEWESQTLSPEIKEKLSMQSPSPFHYLESAVQDETGVSLLRQAQNFEELEDLYKSFYQMGKRQELESADAIKKRDKEAEESFEDFWKSMDESKRQNIGRRSHMHDLGISDDKTGLDLYKKRLHNVWSYLGKPSINIGGDKRYGGSWDEGLERGYLTPYKMLPPTPLSEQPYPWSDKYIDMDWPDIGEMRYGKTTDQGITYDTSPQGREDIINIGSSNPYISEVMEEELGHQAQGRKLFGRGLDVFQRRIDREIREEEETGRDRYYKPGTLENEAHRVLVKDYIQKYLSTGDEKILELLKSRGYPTLIDRGDERIEWEKDKWISKYPNQGREINLLDWDGGMREWRTGYQQGGQVRQSPMDFMQPAMQDETGQSQMDRILAENEISQLHRDGSLWADEPYDPARQFAEGALPVAGPISIGSHVLGKMSSGMGRNLYDHTMKMRAKVLQHIERKAFGGNKAWTESAKKGIKNLEAEKELKELTRLQRLIQENIYK